MTKKERNQQHEREYLIHPCSYILKFIVNIINLIKFLCDCIRLTNYVHFTLQLDMQRFVQSDIDCHKMIGNKTVYHREALIEQITEKAS